MIDLNEYTPINWDMNVKSRLIGRGKPYPTIRILVEEIVHIQCKIKEAKQLYESDKVNLLVERNYTARGIEELGYNTFITILKNKLDEAYYALNRFRNVSSQIPGLGGTSKLHIRLYNEWHKVGCNRNTNKYNCNQNE